MTQPAGWYDDPEEPTQVRYWDGVIWTGRTTPKVNPNLERSGIGMSPPVAPEAGDTAPASSPWDSPRGPGPAPGPLPQNLASAGFARAAATTPDGQPLAGWWRRALARVLDAIIVAIIAIPFTFWAFAPIRLPLQQWMDSLNEAMSAGSNEFPPVPPEVVKYLAIISLMVFVLYGLYEVFFLSRTGATPGKRAVGCSVRLRDVPGPAPAKLLLNRYLVKEGGSVIGLLPLVGLAGSIFWLVNYLWPLWDNQKQALHDKVAQTNVVRGAQPRDRRG